MPYFSKHNMLFIHIPKCGGSTIADYMLKKGDAPMLFDGIGAVKINGVAPQHITGCDLYNLGAIQDSTKLFTVIRHPYERTISEYFYRKEHYDEYKEMMFEEFLDIFLNEENIKVLDNHSLPCVKFIEGISNVNVFKFGQWDALQSFINQDIPCEEKLQDTHLLPTTENNFKLTVTHKLRIISWFEKDFIRFNFDF